MEMYFESNLAGQIAVWLNAQTAIIVDRPFWSVFENGVVNFITCKSCRETLISPLLITCVVVYSYFSYSQQCKKGQRKH
jgi:hypothetical protein